MNRSAFYRTVRIGDKFDYRTNGLRCGYRYQVTSVERTSNPATFGIKHVAEFGGGCSIFSADEFVWRVSTGLPGADGVPVMLTNEPTGPGVYRIEDWIPFVIEIPTGLTIKYYGMYEQEHDPDDPDAPRAGLLLIELETEAVLHLEPWTGRETKRIAYSARVNDLFDQLVESIRIDRDR